MTDEEKFNADIAAMMKSHGNVFNEFVNTNIAERLASITASRPEQREQREDDYRTIRVLQDLQAQVLNCITYDEARRENQQGQS